MSSESDKEIGGEVRALKFKVIGLTTEDRTRLKALGHLCKRIVNGARRVWLTEHTRLGNDRRVRDYMASVEAWHKASPDTRGSKPKSDVQAVPKEIASAMYAFVHSTYKSAHGRVTDLCLHLATERLKNDPATKSAFPRWMRILADDGEFPNSSAPQPIPFDRKNSSIVIPEDGGDFHIGINLEREYIPGRKSAVSTRELLKIQTKGRGCSSQTATLWKIASGEHKFCGSTLVFRESTGEFFVNVSYQMPTPEKVDVDPNKVAILKPMYQRPWFLRITGRNIWIGGRRGEYVGHVRRQLLTQRWSRQGAYKHAGSSNKGHGRKQAMGKLHLLQNRWKDFVKTNNQMSVKEVFDQAISRRVGKIIYCQPSQALADSRFLANEGKTGKADSTSWDWHQLGTMLKAKGKEVGIEVVVKKSGEAKKPWSFGAGNTSKPAAKSKRKAKMVTA